MVDLEFTFEYIRYPVIPVKFNNNIKETPFIDALLDSGGDFIVIPMPIARYLGLILKKAGSVDTAGGTTSIFTFVPSTPCQWRSIWNSSPRQSQGRTRTSLAASRSPPLRFLRA